MSDNEKTKYVITTKSHAFLGLSEEDKSPMITCVLKRAETFPTKEEASRFLKKVFKKGLIQPKHIENIINIADINNNIESGKKPSLFLSLKTYFQNKNNPKYCKIKEIKNHFGIHNGHISLVSYYGNPHYMNDYSIINNEGKEVDLNWVLYGINTSLVNNIVVTED